MELLSLAASVSGISSPHVDLIRQLVIGCRLAAFIKVPLIRSVCARPNLSYFGHVSILECCRIHLICRAPFKSGQFLVASGIAQIELLPIRCADLVNESEHFSISTVTRSGHARPLFSGVIVIGIQSGFPLRFLAVAKRKLVADRFHAEGTDADAVTVVFQLGRFAAQIENRVVLFQIVRVIIRRLCDCRKRAVVFRALQRRREIRSFTITRGIFPANSQLSVVIGYKSNIARLCRSDKNRRRVAARIIDIFFAIITVSDSVDLIGCARRQALDGRPIHSLPFAAASGFAIKVIVTTGTSTVVVRIPYYYSAPR